MIFLTLFFLMFSSNVFADSLNVVAPGVSVVAGTDTRMPLYAGVGLGLYYTKVSSNSILSTVVESRVDVNHIGYRLNSIIGAGYISRRFSLTSFT